MCRNKTGFLRRSPSHDDPMRRIEAPTGFAFDDGTQWRSEFGGWNYLESQMHGVWLDHFDMCKTNRSVVSQDDPEKAVALRLLQDILARRFLLKRLRHISVKEL